LPRREYSKRSDYNVMMRGNHVEITDEGWLHEQDNEKVIRDKDLALEKAVNGQALFMQLFPMDIETEQSKIDHTVEEYVKK